MADIWDCESYIRTALPGHAEILTIPARLAIWTGSSSLVPAAIAVLALGSYMGGSMFLSVLQDLISLSALHLTVISWMMRQIYRWEVSAMYSLWNLFRGELHLFAGRLVDPTG